MALNELTGTRQSLQLSPRPWATMGLATSMLTIMGWTIKNNNSLVERCITGQAAHSKNLRTSAYSALATGMAVQNQGRY